MTTNKEVIDRLEAYFLEQDPKKIARALANALIDFNRMSVLDSLPESEADLLVGRVAQMALQLREFVKHGPSGDFRLIDLGIHD